MSNDLSPAERAAMDVWMRGSPDTTGMLCAVRAALRVQRREMAAPAVEGNGGPCPDCTCCTWAGCHRGRDSDCPVGGEGTYREGESVCPCTEPLS